jgi:hypothetical protein
MRAVLYWPWIWRTLPRQCGRASSWMACARDFAHEYFALYVALNRDHTGPDGCTAQASLKAVTCAPAECLFSACDGNGFMATVIWRPAGFRGH